MPAGYVDADDLVDWAVDRYPCRRHPVVFVGASHGALVHLAAAFDPPWLPQTLVAVRRSGVDLDDPVAELEAGREPGHSCCGPTRTWCCATCTTRTGTGWCSAACRYSRLTARRLPVADFAGVARARRELTWVPTAMPAMSFREAESELRGPNTSLGGCMPRAPNG
ncbi:hypothetical protein EIL87_01915 [Saccharopolyspora rhizosphaerae]|uniref:Alpha/beta hydrolase n=1 Tax=Saccharopolyspora rhizosphaerae TaxID=2492662 RepID=A0A426K5I8_9PSEU|nr:hypothetical protein [Saccharopolyspora rhizosphaerae]RRO20648.1 hypothetical protein EIL87_01915 [Saccharopolyspora rhizosphaerae]